MVRFSQIFGREYNIPDSRRGKELRAVTNLLFLDIHRKDRNLREPRCTIVGILSESAAGVKHVFHCSLPQDRTESPLHMPLAEKQQP